MKQALSFALILSLLFVFPVWAHSPAGTVKQTVEITNKGFQPRNIEIELGDVVHWKNIDEKPHWPASDPHPSHEALQGFDSKEAVSAGQEWEFKFEKEGTWYYHDHLNPHRTAKVVVVDSGKQDNASPPRSFKPPSIPQILRSIADWFLSLASLFDSQGGAQLETPPEIEALLEEHDVAKQNELVRRLLERYPPRQVQEMLKDSGLPFTGESHFIIHVIGDWLYENYGMEGLAQCTDYFLSGCYHGLILHELGDHGTERLPEIMSECEKAGQTVVAQCAHGLGHGFLAWEDYEDLVGAFRMCDMFDDKPYVFNCHDGVSMENVVAAYDASSKDKLWIRKDDPQYPCNVLPKKYQPGCWSNQATLIYFEIYPGDLQKVVSVCDRVPDSQNKEVCYNNFARQVHSLTQGKTENALFFCSFATGKWRDECLLTMSNAAFSVGDREKMPYEVCQALEGEAKERCYNQLVWMIGSHAGNANEQESWCGKLESETHKAQCLGYPRFESLQQ